MQVNFIAVAYMLYRIAGNFQGSKYSWFRIFSQFVVVAGKDYVVPSVPTMLFLY